MEEQTAGTTNPTPQINQPTPLRAEPKSGQGGKTGILAATLVVVVILLVVGFILFRPNSKDEDSTGKSTPVTQNDELSSGLEQLNQGLKDSQEDTDNLNKLKPSNDNDPNNY